MVNMKSGWIQTVSAERKAHLKGTAATQQSFHHCNRSLPSEVQTLCIDELNFLSGRAAAAAEKSSSAQLTMATPGAMKSLWRDSKATEKETFVWVGTRFSCCNYLAWKIIESDSIYPKSLQLLGWFKKGEASLNQCNWLNIYSYGDSNWIWPKLQGTTAPCILQTWYESQIFFYFMAW